MDPIIAGSLIGLGGSIIGGAATPDPPKTYTGLQSKEQLDLINMLARAAARGDGEFGFGSAARSGTATMQNWMAQNGIKGGVASSALGQMLAQAAAQDAGSRRQFAMGASQLRVPTIEYQNIGQGWNGVPGYGPNATAPYNPNRPAQPNSMRQQVGQASPYDTTTPYKGGY